jgi:predicted AlkP superfamily phosphohydrolase/phosphomutase
MISIDSTEVTRIEPWMADGSLPVLRDLRAKGVFARMDSTADLLVGTPWPTFLTGTLPPEHGWLFFRQWRPDLMRSEAFPVAWRSRLKSSLPGAVQDGIADFWVAESRDWSTTRAFPLCGDLEGLIQVNLRGRERDGIVEPGAEYENLVSEITYGLRSFIRLDTGLPLVTAMHRGEEVWPEAARCRPLPDLIVKTDEHSTLNLPGVRSPAFGTVVNYACGRRYDWRSGHHLGVGWFVAAGNDIPANMTLPKVHELDLSATVHALLRTEHPNPMRGQPIAALAPADRT